MPKFFFIVHDYASDVPIEEANKMLEKLKRIVSKDDFCELLPLNIN